MKQILTLFLISVYSSLGYAQVTPIPAVKFGQSISPTDSAILQPLRSTATGQPGLPQHNIRICAPSRARMLQNPPLTIIKYGKREEKSNDPLFMNQITPKDIEAIQIYKKYADVVKYGDEGKNGVIVVTLKSGKASEYRKKFKKLKAAAK